MISDSFDAVMSKSADEAESLAKAKPRVSVVIPVYGRTELLRKALLSLFHQDLKEEYEIIVVDSSPDDRNASLVKELEACSPCSLKCLRKKPEGPGPSRTLGMRQARAEIIAFLDSDCEATPGWLREGLAAFETGVGIVQGKVLPDPSAKMGVFSHYVQVDRESLLYETANIFYRRAPLEQAGGFPPDVIKVDSLGGEDTEAAWNVKRLGWQTRFRPEALVYHAVYSVAPWRWVIIRNLFQFPYLTGRYPELRRAMFWGYFFDRGQALLGLALAGIILAKLSAWSLVLCAPYVVFRNSEPSRSLRGPLRLLRFGPYLARDVCSFLILLAGSLRYRSLLL